MHAPGKQLTRIFLASLTVSSIGFFGGCDSESGKADKEVKTALKSADEKAAAGGEGSTDGAISDLEKAVTVTAASLPSRIAAKSALAQAELNAAKATLRKIDENEVAVAGKLNEIADLGAQIQSGNLLVQSYEKREPKAERDALQAQLAAARGGGDKTAWFTQDKEKSSIPTESVIKQEVSRLEGEISKNEDDLKTFIGQRDQLLTEGDKLQTDSLGAKGEESVKLFKDGSDARKKAADLSVQIDNTSAAIVTLKADLGVAQGQQKVVTEAIAGVEAKLKQLDDSWAEVQKQVEAQNATSKNLLQGTGGEGASSIASRAAEIAKLTEDTRKLRDTAEQKLNNAIKHFDDAAQSAQSLSGELQTAMNDSRDPVMRDSKGSAWAILREIITPANYKMQMGNAQLQLAQMYADRASALKMRGKIVAELGPIFSAAKLTVPSELGDANNEQEEKTARGLADSTYKSAVDTLSTLSQSSASPDMRAAAQIALMTANYAWAESASRAGDTDQANAHMRDAIQAREEAKSLNASFPTLPSDIAPGAAPAAAPTTNPAVTTPAAS